MDADRWARIQAVFHEALECPADERTVFLGVACGDDLDLRLDVEAMLDEDARRTSVLERGLPESATALMADDIVDHLVGRQLGPYRITAFLGEGGMGIVYRAQREDLNRDVAIKVLRGALSPARTARFAFEQRTLARLHHPSIASLFDADTLPDGTSWFAMELVDGVPLTEYCRRHVPSVAGRLALLRTVCIAVQHAHQHLTVHRDLKPSNILVTANGELKLLDFGIAKHLDPVDDAAPDRTLASLRLMTPAYAAPEQITGERIGLHTDVYALGVILYELLTNGLPFDLSSHTPAQAEAIVLDHVPARPSTTPHRLTASRAAWADLDVLCVTAMHRDVSRRYPTVDAFIRDLDHFVHREPLEARPDSWRYRSAKFARRHWRGLAAVSSVVLAFTTLTAVYTWRVNTARRSAETQARRSDRIQRFMLNLFEGGDPEAGPADDLKVLTLIDRGAREARALDGDPMVQVDLYRTLGGLYQKAGRFDDANTLLNLTVERSRTIFGKESTEVGDGLVALGLLRIDEAKLDDADRLIADGLAVIQRAAGPSSAAAARALAAQGRLYEARGSYDRAIGMNEAAVHLETQLGTDRASWIDALGQLADSHYYAGHYEVADRLNGQVLAATRTAYGGQHPRVADVLINLGASQSDRGNYTQAETFYRPALEIFRSYYGDDHFRTASAKTMLGRALVYERRFDEALPLLRDALAVQEKVNGPVHPRVASALNDLGAAALQLKDYDQASAHFSRMIEIYQAVYGGDHYLLATAMSNLGSVRLETRDYTRAEQLYQAAVEMFTRVQSPTHLNVGIARLKLGRALLRQGRFVDAERESRAGYDIIRAQASPSLVFMSSARNELIAEYDGLHQSERAAAIRTELEAVSQSRGPDATTQSTNH